MPDEKQALILHIDDDKKELSQMASILTEAGYDRIGSTNGFDGLEIAKTRQPDLILIDIVMPEMNGYTVCSRLQENDETNSIPIIFISGLSSDQNKAKAFSIGAVDYIIKPYVPEIVLEKIAGHLRTYKRWKGLNDDRRGWYERIQSADFIQFKEFLFDQLDLDPDRRFRLSKVSPSQLYAEGKRLGIEAAQIGKFIAKFLNVSYVEYINPEWIRLGVIPKNFSKNNGVVAIQNKKNRNGFVMSNPFSWDLVDTLMRFSGLSQTDFLYVTAPSNINALFEYVELQPQGSGYQSSDTLNITSITKLTQLKIKEEPVIDIANSIIDTAIEERASDVHIEPKELNTLVRFRVDGDLRDTFTLKKTVGTKLLTRFKALGHLNVAERRKPQDGAFAAIVDNRTFNIRLSTTLTPNGESLVMRLLEPYSRPLELSELGMSGRQEDTLINIANRSTGLILIVGPTGSGKTTTIYSLLHNIDYKTRSMMSVEDPVEYRIPFVNQQQVNERAGVTFDTLLKTAVRQDPDILFMGEIRDKTSVDIAMDFASTGHLTISTMHTTNATSAIFRLERLGLKRSTMADSIQAIVAQRLVKKVCPRCRQIRAISPQEREMLAPFMKEVPERVAVPVGCSKCNNTGYHGREGIYEIIEFTPDIAGMVRNGVSISEIRSYVQKKGGYLLSNHATLKLSKLIVAPKDVYEEILIEERDAMVLKDVFNGILSEENNIVAPDAARRQEQTNGPAKIPHPLESVLLVTRDSELESSARHVLNNEGCRTITVGDGIDALITLGRKAFSLVIAEAELPTMGGRELVPIMREKGFSVPIMLVEREDGKTKEEDRLASGATDFISKRLNEKDFLLKIRNVLAR